MNGIEGLIEVGPEAAAGHALDSWPLAVKRAASGVKPARAAALARPSSVDEVVEVVRWAEANGLAVVPWGAGSSVTGAPLPSADSVVLDTRGLDRIGPIDAESGHVTVGAGVMGGELERALTAEGLTTRFSPQSLLRSTVGGWVATRASGQLSSRWGGIEDAVVGLTVVTADGRVVRLGTAPRGAVGPDLLSLFLGSEGTLGVIVEVVLRIYPDAELSDLDAFVLPDVATGLDLLRAIARDGMRPALLRLYDAAEARHLRTGEDEPGVTLLCGFAGPAAVAAAEHEVLAGRVADAGGRGIGPGATEGWLAGRYDFSRIEAILAEPGGYAETIEVAAPWSRIGSVYEAMRRELGPLVDELVCHFSHVYSDGTSLYVIMSGQAADDREATERLEAIWEVAMRTALATDAVISHHHGVGQARARFLPDQLGEGHELLRRLKSALDPDQRMHPDGLGLATVGSR